LLLAPGGFPNANLGVGGSGVVHTIGSSLPSVDPNNFPGTVHFGQPTTFVGQGYGQYPAGAGFVNQNLGGSGGANFYPNLGAGGGANVYPGL